MAFVKEVLREKPYEKQVEILKAMSHSRRVSVVGCNGSGKDWAAARVVLWWMNTRHPAKAIVTGPTARQVDDIVWNEMRFAYGNAQDRLAGRMFRTSRYALDDQSFALGFATNSPYNLQLENRTHRTSAPHTTSQATIKDIDDGTNSYFSELVWDDGVDNVENMVYMRVRGYTNNGSRTAWTLSEKPQFESSETKEFLAESVNHDTVGGQVAPVENTDYDANTQQGGGGTDISSELTVTHANTTDYNGKGTLIRVVFGATAGYLTLLQLRTLNAIDFDDPVLLLQEDSTSKTAYGERARTIEARWTREVDVALATIASRLARKKDPKTVINVTVPNGSKANLMLMLQRGLSDRVTVSYSDMGISEDFFVEGRTITVSQGWTAVAGELLLRGV